MVLLEMSWALRLVTGSRRHDVVKSLLEDFILSYRSYQVHTWLVLYTDALLSSAACCACA